MLLRGSVLVAVAVALAAPATADAARKPAVKTGGVSHRTPTSVTLGGRVDPNRAATTYYFQIGTTRLYGTNSTPIAAGAGAHASHVSVVISGLAPATKYHYRIVAQNRRGIAKGADRTFKTRVQPLGVTLAATPNPVAPGGAATLAGLLTGTHNAHRQVVLQSNPFPYLQGFVNAANPQVTDAAGRFAFPVLSVAVTTQFRVQMPAKPAVVSPIVVLGAALQVRTHASKVARHRHSVSVRFRGSVAPQNDGGRVSIQKLRGATWVEIAHTRARDDGASRSRYRTRVRVFRSGRFRVVAEAQGQYVSGAGRTITLHVRR